jgi:hypothetical protein
MPLNFLFVLLRVENWKPESISVLALALGVNSSAAVLRPSASPLMPLRCSRQAPELRIGVVW